MAIAIFMESYTASMGLHRRQTLLVPYKGDVLVYSRTTDGQKGPHNKWEATDFDTVCDALSASDEQLTAEPVGVSVTLTDERDIEAKGYSPVLGTKACMAHDKAGPASEPSALVRFCEIRELMRYRSPDLVGYVIDKRQTSEPTPVVIKQHPATAPVEVVVTPDPEPEYVMDDEPVTASAGPVIHASLASVPRQELADRYIHRDINGIEDFRVFDFARDNGINVLIYGPTGPGKTTAVEAWSASRKLRMATVSGNAALEPGHLFGKFVSDGKGGFAWIDGPVTDVVRNGGVLLLDEFNFISPKIYTALYGLTDGRRIITLLDHHGEVIEAHPDLTVFATMNPDYIGTTPLNFAMRNRFDIQIPWDYDSDVESKLVSSKALLNLAQRLRDEAAKGQYETPISTNMLIEFGELVTGLSYEFAVENFIAHFASDEQASVRLVFQAVEYNIKSDFGIDMPIQVDTEIVVDQPTGDVHAPDVNIAAASSVTSSPIPSITVTI